MGAATAEPAADPLAAPIEDAGGTQRSPGERAAQLDSQARYEEAAAAYEEALTSAAGQGFDASLLASRLVELRLAFGEPERAGALLTALERAPGALPPLTLAVLLLRMAEHHQRARDWRQVLGVLTPERLARAGEAPVDLVVRLHAARGRALMGTGQARATRESYGKVLALWPEHESALAGVRASVAAEPPAGAPPLFVTAPEASERRIQARLGSALEVVDEALFLRAEWAVTPAATAPPPRYWGPGDKETVLRFIATELKVWLAARQRAVTHATSGFKAVVDLQPFPSPSWTVEAASRVGTLWADLADTQHGFPAPAAWRRDPTLAQSYRAALADAFAPQQAMGRAAMTLCVSYAAKYQVATPASEHCAAWLSRRYPEQYPPFDELLPAPGWSPPVRMEAPPLGPVETARAVTAGP